MGQKGDAVVLLLIVAVLLFWCWKWLKNASPIPYKFKIPAQRSERLPEDLAEVLEHFGYRLLAGKGRMSLRVKVDDIPLKSRIFVDGFAKEGKNVYVVKMAKDIDLADPDPDALRDKLLPYPYLFDGVAGVLCVDVKRYLVRKIQFKLDADDTAGGKS